MSGAGPFDAARTAMARFETMAPAPCPLCTTAHRPGRPTRPASGWQQTLGYADYRGRDPMNFLQLLRDRIRALAGKRRARKLPRRSAKPPIGARIVQQESGVRLTVQAGLSDELWIWLLDGGWRVMTHRPDRRRYRDISWSQVTRLIDCDPARRERLLAESIGDANSRRTVGMRARG